MIKKNLQYAASLAAIALAVMIIPGILCGVFGLNFVMVSSGLALGVIFMIKGKIAIRIYGSDQNHKASDGAAWIFFAISLLTGVTKIIAHVNLMQSYRDLGYEASTVDSDIIVPILIACTFWAIGVFVCIFLWNCFRKNVKNFSNVEDYGVDSSKDRKAKQMQTEPLKLPEMERKRKKKSIFLKNKYGRIALWGGLIVAIIIISAVSAFVLVPGLKPQENQTETNFEPSSIGKYVYKDAFHVIHIDEMCSNLGRYKIPIDTLEVIEIYKVCSECIRDESYEYLKNLCLKNKKVIENRKKIYYALFEDGDFDGTYEEFVCRMEESEIRRRVYDSFLEEGADIGTYIEFTHALGYKTELEKIKIE